MGIHVGSLETDALGALLPKLQSNEGSTKSSSAPFKDQLIFCYSCNAVYCCPGRSRSGSGKIRFGTSIDTQEFRVQIPRHCECLRIERGKTLVHRDQCI